MSNDIDLDILKGFLTAKTGCSRLSRESYLENGVLVL